MTDVDTQRDLQGEKRSVRLERTTLTEQVLAYILDLIREHRLGVGSEVPSEMQVIRDLGVSRGVVREAFKSLEILGILKVGSGRRPRVEAFNPRALRIIFSHALATEQVTTSDILDYRRLMEVSSVGLAARNGTAADFDAIRHHMDHIRSDISDLARFLEHDVAFHVAIADATKSAMHAMVLRAVRTAVEQTIIEGLYDERIRNKADQIVDLHQRITDTVCARDEAGARRAMEDHFNSVVNDLIECSRLPERTPAAAGV